MIGMPSVCQVAKAPFVVYGLSFEEFRGVVGSCVRLATINKPVHIFHRFVGLVKALESGHAQMWE